MRGDRFQIALIVTGAVAAGFFGVFFLRELFPEYKIYQNAYVELEEFRSTYTGQPPPAFRFGIQQIVRERKDKGPVEIDRCISCHVALEFQHFSPTKLSHDINGALVLDDQGIPQSEPNPDYIWNKLDQKIADLTDPRVNEDFIAQGRANEVRAREQEAEKLKRMKTARVGNHAYDMAKVLQMHPLIGRETRPFEFHPVADYGCTVCHGGNGRGLTTEKAHGPVFDGAYEEEDMGPVPQFLEKDEKNDPTFSRVFNAKPGHELLFQTTPILVGSLIEANCMQCHRASFSQATGSVDATEKQLQEKASALLASYSRDLDALVSTIQLRLQVEQEGVAATVNSLNAKRERYTLPETERSQYQTQATLLSLLVGGADGLRKEDAQAAKDVVLDELFQKIAQQMGSEDLAHDLLSKVDPEGVDVAAIVNQFVQDHSNEGSGPIFAKEKSVQHGQEYLSRGTLTSTHETMKRPSFLADIDLLTTGFHRGEELFLNQACYACHKIAGFSRGGIGPELTEIGGFYPWYIKQSIVWPQADLKTSTMPNYHLDHEELEDLVTFLLAQRGRDKSTSETDYRIKIARWEEGKKLPWEKSVSAARVHDVDYGMTVFATEGCAACHRLRGFTSNTGFAIEKKQPTFNQLFQEREWFQQTIPETISGSDLVKVLELKAEQLDKRIVPGVREHSLIEQIEVSHPGNAESFYSQFKYAMRAKNHELKGFELEKWQERVRRVLMVYIQEYGYGRLVGPRPNWSGIFRSDEWLMEHFKKPSSLVARSIMPVFPFEETKFYALTYMLDVIGKQNRDRDRQVWEEKGFNPAIAYELYCAQCHGDQRVGNGPVAEWIYPVPKNLRNADFMWNLTPERARDSILHGVKGGPMPGWGESFAKATTGNQPVLTRDEAEKLVDWLYSILPGGTVIRGDQDVLKWNYTPEDVIEELRKEQEPLLGPLSFMRLKDAYYAALDPVPNARVEVGSIFSVQKAPVGTAEANAYYIQNKYYTPENLTAGKEYFEMNCAVCHGRDADGSGNRAGVMIDAKPRMLTNFPWLKTRDDLRLLRSIKFGVSGTSMQPWGDQTTSLQRLQLVMYIRSLSQEQKQRDALDEVLYRSFEGDRLAVERARVEASPILVKLQKQLDEVEQTRKDEVQRLDQGKSTPERVASIYAKELKLRQEVKKGEAEDQSYEELRRLLQQERTIYDELGTGIIGLSNNTDLLDQFLEVIRLHGQMYTIQKEKLVAKDKNVIRREMIQDQILSELQARLVNLDNQLNVIKGKIASPERNEAFKDLQATRESLTKLRNQFIAAKGDSKRLRLKQMDIIQELNHE